MHLVCKSRPNAASEWQFIIESNKGLRNRATATAPAPFLPSFPRSHRLSFLSGVIVISSNSAAAAARDLKTYAKIACVHEVVVVVEQRRCTERRRRQQRPGFRDTPPLKFCDCCFMYFRFYAAKGKSKVESQLKVVRQNNN